MLAGLVLKIWFLDFEARRLLRMRRFPPGPPESDHCASDVSPFGLLRWLWNRRILNGCNRWPLKLKWRGGGYIRGR